MEVVKQSSKAEALIARASTKLKKMINDYKKQEMAAKKIFEKIRIKAYEEKFTDNDVWIMMNYAMEDMPISLAEKRDLLKGLKPVKDMEGLEKISSRAGAEVQETTVMICNFNMIDKDENTAKEILIKAIREAKGRFEIHCVDTDVIGFVPNLS